MTLDSELLDVLAEIGNIATGAASTALSQLVQQDLRITTPDVSVVNRSTVEDEFPCPCVIARITFSGGIEGDSMLLLEIDNARRVAGVLLSVFGQPPIETAEDNPITEVELSAVSEIMNQMMGASARAYGELLGEVIDISPPNVEVRPLKSQLAETMDGDPKGRVVTLRFSLELEDGLRSDILQVMEIPFARKLADRLMKAMVMEDDAGDDAHEDEEAAEEHEQRQPVGPVVPVPSRPGELGLDQLSNFTVSLSALFGGTRVSLETLSSLEEGSAVQLDRDADAPVKLRVNDMDFAEGELVVMGGKLGVRIVDFLDRPKGGAIR